MKIVLTELEMKEAIADYMAKQESSVEIIKMDPDEIPVPEKYLTGLGIELGKNTMEQPFKPEAPIPVKRTRGPNKKTTAPVETPPTIEPIAETKKETVPAEAKENDPFILDETDTMENPGTEELELDSPTEEISDEVNLFA